MSSTPVSAGPPRPPSRCVSDATTASVGAAWRRLAFAAGRRSPPAGPLRRPAFSAGRPSLLGPDTLAPESRTGPGCVRAQPGKLPAAGASRSPRPRTGSRQLSKNIASSLLCFQPLLSLKPSVLCKFAGNWVCVCIYREPGRVE